MTNTNSTPSTQRTVLDIFKWIFSFILLIMGVITVFSSRFPFGGFFIILGAIILTPFVSGKLKQKFSLWKYRAVRLTATLGVLFVGIVLSGSGRKEKPSSEKHNEIIRKYVEANKDKPFLKNLQLLEEWNYAFEPKNNGERSYYFSDRYSETYTPLDTLKDSSVVYGLFLENSREKTVATEKYMKSVPDYGQLNKYFVAITVNKKNEITKAVGMFGNTDDEIKEIADQNFDLSQYADLEVIKKQIETSDKELAEIRGKAKYDANGNRISSENSQNSSNYEGLKSISPADIYSNFQDKGFTIDKQISKEGSLFYCTKEYGGIKYDVTIYAEDNVNEVTEVKINAYRNQANLNSVSDMKPFLKYAVSIPYNGADVERIQRFVDENYNNHKASVTISGVKFTIYCSSEFVRLITVENDG